VPSLLIRNVDATLHTRLKQRAAAHRRSLEEEVRELLRGAVMRRPQEEHIVDLALRLFGQKHGVELDIPPRGNAPERPPPDFSQLADEQ
jgi:plasmid stability protein